MAFLRDRKLFVGGKPVLVLSGEVHYFRLKRSEWRDRIRKAKEAECNAIASYIPWMFHEESEGQIDLVGTRRPEHDLGAFIDLCKEEGLWFIARPGPFVMGEVKNEGIPDWIYTKCPGAVPTTWAGKKATSKTLSYLDAGFLSDTKRWYDAVGSVLKSRLEPSGGNVIAYQLCNEIGMLQCWTEEADLSDDVLCDFAAWVQAKRPHDEILKQYGFDLGDPYARVKFLRDGAFPGALVFHSDYTGFTRDRFARYASKLREFAEGSGVTGIPFILNIHGSGGGRATTFPIGVSQTYAAYTQAEGFWGASDHYLGELTRQNVQDLYFLNAFMECVNRPEQPLASVEFEAGTGDYGENGSQRQSGAATDFKARLSVVQGNRLLNHYLLAGGRNPMLEHPKTDGNSRLGTTGERHGFAAPIGPEGNLDLTYFSLKETNATLKAVGPLLAEMEEERDAIALGFVPDYYSTDVKPAGPMRELAERLESARGPLESLVRAMIACGLSFPAVNLQAKIPAETKAIALATSQCLHASVQQSIVEFVDGGGRLLLYGDPPELDLEGNPAKILIEKLGIRLHPPVLGSPDSFPSMTGVGWASHEPEVRAWRAPAFEMTSGRPFLRLTQTDRFLGAFFDLGMGRIALVTSEIPLHLSLWSGLFRELGVTPAVAHDVANGGVVLSRMTDRAGGRFISLINLDQEDKEFHVREGHRSLFGGTVFLPGRRAKLLPINLKISGIHILASTAEITEVRYDSIDFRRGLTPERIVVSGPVKFDESLVRELKTGELEIQPGRGSVRLTAS